MRNKREKERHKNRKMARQTQLATVPTLRERTIFAFRAGTSAHHWPDGNDVAFPQTCSWSQDQSSNYVSKTFSQYLVQL